ncbi:MAG: hypothetical protein MI861_00585, partial [Pirellulales bacterium]|nr:hypothetical protein [Pirellulales bacterium]
FLSPVPARLPASFSEPFMHNHSSRRGAANSLYVMLAGIGWQLARDRTAAQECRWIGLLMLSTLAAYLCNGMFQDVLIIPMVHMYLFFIAGLATTVYTSGLLASRQASPSGARNTLPAARYAEVTLAASRNCN